jgi:hypothetical protein
MTKMGHNVSTAAAMAIFEDPAPKESTKRRNNAVIVNAIVAPTPHAAAIALVAIGRLAKSVTASSAHATPQFLQLAHALALFLLRSALALALAAALLLLHENNTPTTTTPRMLVVLQGPNKKMKSRTALIITWA